METPQDPSSATNRDAPSPPTAEGGKIRRIAGHTQALVEDLREWIDLRLDLVILDVEERIEELRNELALGVVLVVLGLFSALFALTTIALGVGWALGRPFWGFLIVSGVLLGGTGLLVATRPNLMPPTHLYQRIRGDDEQFPDPEDAP